MNKTKFTSDWRIMCRKCESEVPIDSHSCPHCGVSLYEGIDILFPIVICVDEKGNRIERTPLVEEIEYLLMLKKRLDIMWSTLLFMRIQNESQGSILQGGVHWKEESALDRVLEERLQYHLKITGRPPQFYQDGMKWKAAWKKHYIFLRRWLGGYPVCQKAEERTEENGRKLGKKMDLGKKIRDALGF